MKMMKTKVKLKLKSLIIKLWLIETDKENKYLTKILLIEIHNKLKCIMWIT